MTEYVHDFSSLEPIRPVTPEELKKNEEETSEIQSTASIAKVWKVLSLGGVKSSDEARQILDSRGLRVLGRANTLLGKTDFPGIKRVVKLAVVSGTDISFHENRGYKIKEWKERFLAKGFLMPSAEAIFSAFTCFAELELGKRYTAMMEPITIVEDGKTQNLVFVMSDWSGSRDLFTAHGDDDELYYPEHLFIVEIP